MHFCALFPQFILSKKVSAEARRTEPHKPPRSSQGPRRYKQRSKR